MQRRTRTCKDAWRASNGANATNMQRQRSCIERLDGGPEPASHTDEQQTTRTCNDAPRASNASTAESLSGSEAQRLRGSEAPSLRASEACSVEASNNSEEDQSQAATPTRSKRQEHATTSIERRRSPRGPAEDTNMQRRMSCIERLDGGPEPASHTDEQQTTGTCNDAHRASNASTAEQRRTRTCNDERLASNDSTV